MKTERFAVTLLELLIAIGLFSLIVVGLSSIGTFSRHHVMSSERRVKLQNELSYALEHMSKNIQRATGDATRPALSVLAPGDLLSVRVDPNPSNPTVDISNDIIVTYSHSFQTIDGKVQGILSYTDPNDPSTPVVLSRHIVGFPFSIEPGSGGLGVQISLVARWIVPIGPPDNIEVRMTTKVYSRNAEYVPAP